VTERAGEIEVEKGLDATGEMHREEFGYPMVFASEVHSSEI
jgi:hypothetical protein